MTAVGRVCARCFAWLAVVALIVPGLGCPSKPAAAVVPPHNPAVTYDVTPRPISVIPPGTVIGDGPPEGWTHLLIKSYPRAGAGDVDRLSASMRDVAEKLFSVMVARVEVVPDSQPPRYRFAEVASGVGVRIGEQDVVVSPDRYREFGARLGLYGPWALDAAYGRVKAAAIVLSADALMVYDAPMIMLRDGRHAPVVLRYAFVLDPATGRLDWLQWFIDQDADGGYLTAQGPMELLAPGHQETRIVHIDASKFRFGFLTEQALALTKLYTGRKQLPFPEGFQELAGQKPFTPESAAVLDATLRRLIQEADAP
jgi:hypothetical protein